MDVTPTHWREVAATPHQPLCLMGLVFLQGGVIQGPQTCVCSGGLLETGNVMGGAALALAEKHLKNMPWS